MSIKIFISYAHKDQELHEKLVKHLGALKRAGQITIWQDQEIPPGSDWRKEILTHLNEADLILLLVSVDFIASNYCWNDELQLALKRHEAGTARVIPIILRPVDWQDTPLRQLQALPAGARAVTEWNDQEAALVDVVRGIREVVVDLSSVLPKDTGWRWSRRAIVLSASAVLVGGVTWLALKDHSFAPSIKPAQEYPSPLSTKPLQGYPSTPLTEPQPSGTTLLALRGHAGAIQSVAWSPDGKWLASASRDHTVRVWDTVKGGLLLSYLGHSSQVYTVAWSPNGKQLASAGGDRTVQVWDASSEKSPLLSYQFHTQLVREVSWSPDGKQLASASDDKTVRVWDASNGKTLVSYTGHASHVLSVAWSPDGKWIASAGDDDKTVQVWDASNGKTLLTYTGHTTSVKHVAWSPDGRRLASGSAHVYVGDDNTVQIWEASSGKTLLTLAGDESVWVAWSPDGKRLASAGSNYVVMVWDIKGGDNSFTYRGHTGHVYTVAWSPDGKRLASGGDIPWVPTVTGVVTPLPTPTDVDLAVLVWEA
jgi:WD40 repeat protein